MKLKEIRKNKKLSQAQLAEASGVSLRYIRTIEQGTRDINNSEVRNVYRLAVALECEMVDLIDVDKIQIKK